MKYGLLFVACGVHGQHPLYVGAGQHDKIAEAIPLLANSQTNNWGYLAYPYGRAGRRTEAES